MPEKLWDEMTVDEKLGGLRAKIQGLIDTGKANAAMLDARDNALNQRLAEVEAKVNTVTEATAARPSIRSTLISG